MENKNGKQKQKVDRSWTKKKGWKRFKINVQIILFIWLFVSLCGVV